MPVLLEAELVELKLRPPDLEAVELLLREPAQTELRSSFPTAFCVYLMILRCLKLWCLKSIKPRVAPTASVNARASQSAPSQPTSSVALTIRFVSDRAHSQRRQRPRALQSGRWQSGFSSSLQRRQTREDWNAVRGLYRLPDEKHVIKA